MELAYADGRVETYTILGVWDRDEALGIISSESQMAQALEGHRAGETLEVPAESGTMSVTLRAVTGLSPAVRDWLK